MKNLVWTVILVGGATLFGKGMYEAGRADQKKEDMTNLVEFIKLLAKPEKEEK